jgi:hypothetical protein
MEGFEPSSKYRIFNDIQGDSEILLSPTSKSRPAIPTHEEVTNFYRSIFTRAQMEADCIIMSLIYVERLMKCTQGELRPSASNWRSILFSCMLLSSKVWDDLSMWNADFGQTCPRGVRFTLQRTNELELAVLAALGYTVKVHASEYAKYYFLLRSMLIKSGLGGEDLHSMDPLDVEGAKRLQHVSSRYQLMKTGPPRGARISTRSKSAGYADPAPSSPIRNNVPVAAYEFKSKASLEHVVHM